MTNRTRTLTLQVTFSSENEEAVKKAVDALLEDFRFSIAEYDRNWNADICIDNAKQPDEEIPF